MPKRIQAFRNLLGVKLCNSTLVSWAEEAALKQRYHPRVRSAFFIRTEFANGSLPDGLLSSEFPSLLRDIVFAVTNVNWITLDLHLR